MNKAAVNKILKETDYTRCGGTKEEKAVAQYLMDKCQALGVEAHIETFEVQMADIKKEEIYADGKLIATATAFKNCGNADLTADFVYIPDLSPVSLTKCKDKIVMIDQGMPYRVFAELWDAGAKGFITWCGSLYTRDEDVDRKELRAYVSKGNKLPGFCLHAKDAFRLVKTQTKEVRMVIEQDEYMGDSQNVVAEIPGTSDEWICLTAHYDSTMLSHGAYDNMTGCLGLLGIMEAMKATAPHRYGLRFIFCGSEERGLLGSKAYVAAHKEELEKVALCVNLDMIGSVMGKFIACCTTETKTVDYINYLSKEVGFSVNPYQDIYSSDSSPFADSGVPAISFARLAGDKQAPIHVRYDTMKVLSAEQILEDTAFIVDFVKRMADSAVCPVSKDIPANLKEKLEVYMARKRKIEKKN